MKTNRRITVDALPHRWRVALFPALLTLFGIVVISLGINGTSSGELYGSLHSGSDPALIAGHPQKIRSDEWNVGTVWSISQVAQGLPAVNHTFPGGMDASLPYDLPRHEWSIAFRPHQLGFLFLDAGHATAWSWWVTGLSLIAAAWAFLIAVLPRRPIVAGVLSLGFFFSPFFQWWHQSTTFWPVVWALVTMAAVVSLAERRRLVPSILWAVIVSYLTVVMAMGIYAPFIVPVVLVVALFSIGVLVGTHRRGASWHQLGLSAIPIVAAGLVGSAISAVWLRSVSGAVEAFLSTTYPGQRLTPTGTGNALSVARTISSSFSEALMRSGGFLGINSSEAATYFLAGAFLAPVIVWAIWRQAKRHATLPWELISLAAGLLLLIAFMLVPGWSAVAHLLFLDRSTSDRVRIGVGLASFAMIGYVIRYLESETVRAGRALASVTAVIFFTSQCAIAVAVVVIEGSTKLWSDSPFWWIAAFLSALSLYLFSRRHVVTAALCFLAVAVASSAAVNPVYSGVLDLRTTEASRAIRTLDAEVPGNWVAIGDPVVNDIVIESGVAAYNGTQGAPSRTMWKQIDPSSKYEAYWNRLGGVTWIAGVGEPVVSNPAPDQIVNTFDACSGFALKHVTYVFSNQPLTSTCLTRVRSFPTPQAPLTIYRVLADW